MADPDSAWTLAQALRAERDYTKGQVEVLKQRLAGMDKATSVLHETITRVPTDLEREIKNLRELIFAQLTTVKTQIGERDARQDKDHADNQTRVQTAVTAQQNALAAVEQRIEDWKSSIHKELGDLRVAQSNAQARQATWFIAIGLFVSVLAVVLRFL